MSQGKITEAMARYAEALRINPSSAEVHYNLGIALAKQGRVEEAIFQFYQTLRLQRN